MSEPRSGRGSGNRGSGPRCVIIDARSWDLLVLDVTLTTMKRAPGPWHILWASGRVPSLFLPSDVARVAIEGMPRRLRLQYPGAIYHLMARGNGRQDIVCDDIDRDRLMEHLGRAAVRCSWHIYA